jgi:acyl-CoA reductase-like NAD-dependent aldehyde dehydrogenase
MKIQSINPSTGAIIKEFNSTTAKEIQISFQKAKHTQQQWTQTSVQERIKLFRHLHQQITDNLENILTLMYQETGKLKPDAEAEVYDVLNAIDYYGQKITQLQPDTSVSLNPEAFPDTNLKLTYVPYGIIGLIMPWNFPFYSPMMFVIAAIMAGNSVLLKPSEYSTMVGLEIGNLFTQAGFPQHLVSILPGDESTGKALVKAGCDKLFFVGSVEAGKDIIAHAGITPVQVELGGNSAAIVLHDADIDLAVQGIAWGGTYHSGQDCVGIKRVFVHQQIADQFINQLINVITHLRPGQDYGPYIRQQALDEVKARIDVAVVEGAELLTGGVPLKPNNQPGYWLSPAVMKYSSPSHQLVTEETFGNVLPINIVQSTQEAIELANQTIYGLSTSLFTQDLTRAQLLADQLQTGMVFINDPFIAIPGWDHWTGWKQSGFGTVESKFMQCLKKKVVSVNTKSHKRSFWYPYE